MSGSVIDQFVEIELAHPDDFLKVKETLTRIGISSNKTKTLFQSCHIFHKRGKFYITHFKEMFMLDGKPTEFSHDDLARRNTIIRLLVEWSLIKVINLSLIEEPQAEIRTIKILPFHQKSQWNLKSKYTIGKG